MENNNHQSLLGAHNLTMQFGGLTAVDKVSFDLGPGDLYGLIGPNGAGKTTVFNILTGVYTPTKGDVLVSGQSVVGLAPNQITGKGLARTFQNIRLFKDLTVLDNIKIARHHHQRSGFLSSLLRLPSTVMVEKQIIEDSMKLLAIFGLDNKAHIKASNLPYGEQRCLEMARALATRPKVLLLDEPAAGMNPIETEKLVELIKQIRREFQVAILLIEHDMKLVMNLCEKIYVMDYGQLIAVGGPKEIQSNKKVIEAYLGQEQE